MNGVVVASAIAQPIGGAVGGALSGVVLAGVGYLTKHPLPVKNAAISGAILGGVVGLVGGVAMLAMGSMGPASSSSPQTVGGAR